MGKGLEMTEDKIKLIALTAAGAVSDKVDEKLEKVHTRITTLSNDVATIKGRISTMPTHDDIETRLERCRVEHHKKSGLTTAGWIKIIGMILTLIAAGFGIDFVANP